MDSTPPGATVTLHGVSGTTPVDLVVPRRHPDQDYMVASSADRHPSEALFVLDGYEPIRVPLAYGSDRWASWGNVVLGGVPAVLVDASNGSAVVIETTDHDKVIDSIAADFRSGTYEIK